MVRLGCTKKWQVTLRANIKNVCDHKGETAADLQELLELAHVLVVLNNKNALGAHDVGYVNDTGEPCVCLPTLGSSRWSSNEWRLARHAAVRFAGH